MAADPIVVDVRANSKSSAVQEAKNLNINIKFSHGIVNSKGYLRVNSAIIGKLNSDKSGYENLEKCFLVIVYVYREIGHQQYIFLRNQEIN